MIEAQELTKRYGGTTAVHSLSFTIAPGTVTGFLGPNGAGKSTTMRMIMGLDRPTSGTVTVTASPTGSTVPRPQDAHPRRAGQRARPRGRAVDPPARARPGRRRTNRLPLLAPDERDVLDPSSSWWSAAVASSPPARSSRSSTPSPTPLCCAASSPPLWPPTVVDQYSENIRAACWRASDSRSAPRPCHHTALGR